MDKVSSGPHQQRDSCSICTTELCGPRANRKSVSFVNPCRHLFHTNCIYRWAAKHTTCPLGRRAIVSLELRLPLPRDWQALMVSGARDGEYDQVLGLLNRGASVDADRRYRDTPFAIAAANKHFSIARLLADHGSTDWYAQFSMGKMLLHGDGVEKDEAKSFEWFAKSADQGFAEAQFSLGHMYWHGIGVLKNTSLAVDWLKKAVAQESVSAEALLGDIFINNAPFTDIPQGLQLLNKAVRGNSSYAMETLGRLYWKGIHVDVDMPKAQQLLEQAVELSYIPAKKTLAEYYLELKDKEKLPQVFTLLQSAIDHHSTHPCTDAMTLLGILYRNLRKDPIRALWLFHQAANQKDPYGLFELGYMYDTGEGVPKDPAKAFSYFQEAAMLGNSHAEFRMGLMFLHGSFGFEDWLSAKYWLHEAAKKGHKKATEKLELIQKSWPRSCIDI